MDVKSTICSRVKNKNMELKLIFFDILEQENILTDKLHTQKDFLFEQHQQENSF